MTSAATTRIGFRSIALGVVAVSLAGAVFAASSRGIWLDEFWSLRLGDPHVPLARAVDSLWFDDTNPVWANLLYRLTAETGARGIAELRLLLNLPASALLVVGTLVFTRTSPARDPFYLTLAMLVAALPVFTATFSDYRIYHWQVCATALLCQSAYRILVEGQATPNRVASAVAAAALLAALTLHFVAGFLVAIPVGLLLLVLARRGRWRSFAPVALVAGLAASSMLALAAVQGARISRTIDVSWIETSTADALAVIAATLVAGLIANPVAAAVALLAPRDVEPGRRDTLVLILTGVAIGAALLLAANAFRPLIVERYLLPWQVAVCAVVAVLGAPTLERGGWKLFAVAACCLLSIGLTTRSQSRVVGWGGTRDFIADTIRRCPTTRVNAISPWRLRSSRDSRAAAFEAPLFESAYRRLANDAGFAVTFVADAVRVLDIPAECPSLLWIEHSGGARLGDAASLLHDAGIGFAQRSRVSRFSTADGVVVIAERAGERP